MKTVKILGDTLNKVADTSTVFDFRLWNEGLPQDVTGKTVSFTIANDSGYLFDVPAVIDGNVVSLDFSNELLKQLTPDTYHMEVSVTNADGDVEVYPSQGTIDFRVGKNLHSTAGKLVPQITFDTVLRSVDEKIAEYTKTIAKGEKGDTGPQGPQGIQGPMGPQGPVGPQGPSNDAQLVHKTGNETVAGNKTFTSLINGALSTRASTFTDFAIVATKMFDYAGTWYVNGTSILNKPSDVGNYLIVKVTPANIPGSGKIEVFEFTSGKTYINNVALNTLGQWVKLANDSNIVHNTGNETVAGDKTLTGNTTLATTTILAGNYGLRVTPSGFQKTTDGRTWVSANI